MKLTKAELSTLKRIPYWAEKMKPNEDCKSCRFPSEHAENGDFCPYCGYPDNAGGLDTLCVS